MAIKERIRFVIGLQPGHFSIFTHEIIYPFYLNRGIRTLPCCVRDEATLVLSQHLQKGSFTQQGNAIGFGQGEALWQDPPASAGSKLRFTRHGGVFLIKIKF